MIYIPKTDAENQQMASWAAKIVGTDGFRDYRCMGFAHKGRMLCVVVAYDWSPPNCFVSIASVDPRWCTQGNLRHLVNWLFVQLKCERVTGLVARRNKRARKFNEGLGFRIEGTHPKMLHDGGTLMTYGLLKQDAEALLARIGHGTILKTEAA